MEGSRPLQANKRYEEDAGIGMQKEVAQGGALQPHYIRCRDSRVRTAGHETRVLSQALGESTLSSHSPQTLRMPLPSRLPSFQVGNFQPLVVSLSITRPIPTMLLVSPGTPSLLPAPARHPALSSRPQAHHCPCPSLRIAEPPSR